MGLPSLVCCQVTYAPKLFLQELLANYSCPTKAEFKCGLCGAKGDASQQQSVCRWPKILVLQLARFSTDEAVPVEQRFSSYQKVICTPAMTSACRQAHSTAAETLL